MYANAVPVVDYKLSNTERADINCSVRSYPESRIALYKGSALVSNDTSCLTISPYEFLCSLFVNEFDLSEGFYCEVLYDTFETGVFTKVEPDECFDPIMSPTSSEFKRAITTNEVIKTYRKYCKNVGFRAKSYMFMSTFKIRIQ